MPAKGLALKNQDSFFVNVKIWSKKLVFASYTMSAYRLLGRHRVAYTVSRKMFSMAGFPSCLAHGSC